MTEEQVKEENDCGEPCDPKDPCDICAGYWQRMRQEGYWVDGKGWTEKGWREICK